MKQLYLLAYVCLISPFLFAQAGSPGDPFTSLAQARGVTAAGTYSFALDGVIFRTHVDADGFVMLAYDDSNAKEALPLLTELSVSSYGMLPPGVLATLGDTYEIRMSSDDAAQLDAVTLANDTLRARLTTYRSLMTGTADNPFNEGWIGAGSLYLRKNARGARAPRPLNEEIFHVNRNSNSEGVHWIPLRGDRSLVYDDEIPVPEGWRLWVRGAAPVSGDAPGSFNNPFTSLSDALTVSRPGTYHFELDGTSFSTLVDTNGYVQVAVDYGESAPSALPQTVDLDGTARGILTPGVLATLTAAREIRMSSGAGDLNATTTNATMLERIRTNTVLFNGSDDNAINDDWVGTGAQYLTDDSRRAQSSQRPLQEEIYHVYYAENEGMHWIPYRGDQALVYQADVDASENYTLWVRSAPRCPISVQDISATSEACRGTASGELVITASCTDCPDGVVYSLDNHTFQSANVFTGLAAGAYTVYLRPAGVVDGCVSVTRVDVPAGPEVSLPLSEGAETGSIDRSCWKPIDGNGNGGWQILEDAGQARSGSSAYYLPPATESAHADQLLGPAFPAVAGVSYSLSFAAAGAGLSVHLLNAGDSSIVDTLWMDEELATDYAESNLRFTVPGDGDYRLAFVSDAAAGANGIWLDDILLAEFAEPTDGAAQLATAANEACMTVNGFGLAGSAWVRFLDPEGRVALEINPNGNELGDVVVELRDYLEPPVAPYNGQYHLSRHFNVSPSNGPGPYNKNGGVEVRLYFTDAELQQFNTTLGESMTWSDLAISHYSDLPGGTEDCSIYNSQNGRYTVETVDNQSDYGGTAQVLTFSTTTFSEFAATSTSSASALPVTLTDFRATAAGPANRLYWEVEREDAFSHYAVERSTDGQNFELLTKISGNGRPNYTVEDPAPAELTYYRLRMVDLDGSEAFSPAVSVEREEAAAQLKVWPNPVRNELNVHFPLTGPVRVELQLFSGVGRLLRTVAVQGRRGPNQHQLAVGDLPRGQYVLRLVGAGEERVLRFVK
jgi:hypothetical protein